MIFLLLGVIVASTYLMFVITKNTQPRWLAVLLSLALGPIVGVVIILTIGFGFDCGILPNGCH